MADDKVVDINNVDLNAEAVNKLILEQAEKEGIDPKTLISEPNRDEFGRFVSPKPAKKEPEEQVIYKDKFIVGGKEVEFEDPTVDGLLRQVKAAQAAAAAAAPKPEEKKTPAVEFTDAERFELGVQIAAGKTDALEAYILKSGLVERVLAAKGVDVSQLKETVESNISAKKVATWENATTEFLADSDWPGGQQNLKLMQYKLAELGLADKPSVDSLQAAYDALKEDNLLFEAAEAEPKKQVGQTEAQRPPAPKKQMKSGTMLGTSQETTTRRTSPGVSTAEAKLKAIIDDPNTDPREIMRIYNEEMASAGKAQRG